MPFGEQLGELREAGGGQAVEEGSESCGVGLLVWVNIGTCDRSQGDHAHARVAAQSDDVYEAEVAQSGDQLGDCARRDPHSFCKSAGGDVGPGVREDEERVQLTA